VLQIGNFAPGGTVNSQFNYTYNALGLETTETTPDGNWTYAYDGIGELVHAVFAPNMDRAFLPGFDVQLRRRGQPDQHFHQWRYNNLCHEQCQ